MSSYKRVYINILIGFIGVVQLQYVGTEVSDVKNTEFIDIYIPRACVWDLYYLRCSTRLDV